MHKDLFVFKSFHFSINQPKGKRKSLFDSRPHPSDVFSFLVPIMLIYFHSEQLNLYCIYNAWPSSISLWIWIEQRVTTTERNVTWHVSFGTPLLRLAPLRNWNAVVDKPFTEMKVFGLLYRSPEGDKRDCWLESVCSSSITSEVLTMPAKLLDVITLPSVTPFHFRLDSRF